ncbi:hypothetical protein DIS16_09955 [Levilactobacillus brevis]|uniref:hypothetical protein n=1 Tax=Levilactobacillus brevis TaxID=1580 RepID=UPI00111E4BA1|nr:hypothetical protein [Levilactobacillus brevis]TOY75102.1 hypothetical protein DIS16_09955 [Levilactobacillus brevis]
MKIKTFWTAYFNDDEFETSVNNFIKDKIVIQISTGDSLPTDDDYVHTLTVLYEEAQHDDTRTD